MPTQAAQNDVRFPSRRDVLKLGAAWSGALLASTRACPADVTVSPPRAITRGPKHHWFGYYDKLQFDPTNRFALGMEVDFEHRQPTPDDRIAIGMVDLEQDDRWIELAHSGAWCWQQGCMLQWIPGSNSEILWNDRERDRFVCHILDVDNGARRTMDFPVYTVAPDGRKALSLDFGRLNDVRPGYGYAGIADPHANESAPQGTGVFRLDLATGERQLLFSIAEIAAYGAPLATMKDAKHWFNHLLFNPAGSRFVFLHRWQGPAGKGTRMFTAAPDGSQLRLVDANGLTSHFIWRDAKHILAYSRQASHGQRFYLFEDTPHGSIEAIGVDRMTTDGHVSYLPDRDWILNDTYPQGEQRAQNVYLYHIPTNRRISLGYFRVPLPYRDSWRCDTHPRLSRDGRKVVIDSPHGAHGRQMYLFDIAEIVG